MGFETVELRDGHDIAAIIKSVDLLKASQNEKPKLIIANTIKGKGISYMEDTIDWHYWPMNKSQYEQAVNEINEKYA